MTFTVYILRTAKNTLYTGQTNNIEKRLKQHNGEIKGGAKYTKCFGKCELVYSEEFETRSEAIKREAEIKRMEKKEKEELIN